MIEQSVDGRPTGRSAVVHVSLIGAYFESVGVVQWWGNARKAPLTRVSEGLSQYSAKATEPAPTLMIVIDWPPIL